VASTSSSAPSIAAQSFARRAPEGVSRERFIAMRGRLSMASDFARAVRRPAPGRLDATDRMKSIPGWARQSRAGWRYTGQERPAFAVAPGPGEESVWDYPRPPRIEHDAREIMVRVGPILIAHSRRSARVLETGSPPSFYIPPEDVALSLLRPSVAISWCEWKG